MLLKISLTESYLDRKCKHVDMNAPGICSSNSETYSPRISER